MPAPCPLLPNLKKRSREGGNIARTFRTPGEMSTPPPSRTVTRVGSPPTDEFTCPIPTAVAMPVAFVQESSLPLLGDDSFFTRAMNFTLPSNLEELIRSVPEDDLFYDGVEMMCRA